MILCGSGLQMSKTVDVFFFLSNFDSHCVLLQWFETEQARLTSLRDRASETGRKKEYPFFTSVPIASG